jgi:hypothetical protein
VKQNRYILRKLIDAIKFCGAFELALRGHDEGVESNNPGIFRRYFKITHTANAKRDGERTPCAQTHF